MDNWLEGMLGFSMVMVAGVTLGYPLFLFLAAPLLRRPWRVDDALLPPVTLIIAAHNEERVIAARLENALALDYPRALLEIVVASDGSTDGTAEIADEFAARGVQVRRYPRSGKTGIQNEAVKSAGGTIVVFSDANSFYRPDAIRKLVRNFADDEVAAVCGRLDYRATDAGAGECERRYWDYEKFLKQRESELSSLTGANGSIYAVRRSDYVELEHDMISDFVEPLALVLRRKRVVYEPEAIALEEVSPTYGVEFRRKVRILTRAIGGLVTMRALLNPFRYGLFAIQLLMHKLMRYLVPLFLATGMVSLTALAVRGHYRLLFAVAALFIVAACSVNAGQGARRVHPLLRLCHLAHYYLMVNYALVLAWVNIVRGRRMTFWAPERERAS
jgi:cellulose synthase/poly-beta-1,6-N-acetylglucosamine synthase-like glycosyltransferase